jgi:hypothetical protein
MATINKMGQVEYQGGEALPAVGSDIYKAAQQGSIIPNVSSSIKATDLSNGATPFINPSNNNNASIKLAANIDATANTAETNFSLGSAEDAAAVKVDPKKGVMDRISEIIGLQRKQGEKTLQYQKEEDVFDKKSQVRKLENDIIAKTRAYDKQIEKLRLNSEGKFGGAVEQDIANLERQKNSELADMAIQYKVAAGDYNQAFEIAQAKVDAEFEPLKNEIASLTQLYNLYQNDLTESEKMQVQAQIQEKQAQLNFGREKELLKYKDEIEQANPMFAAELALKNAQIGKINSEINPQVTTSGELEQIDTVDSLLKNEGGLRAAVGPNFLARGGAAPGKRKEFLAGAQQLTSQLTIQNLQKAKANGATFGALSEGELSLVAGSATKLNTWAEKDKNGNILRYKTTEANVRRELDNISNLAKKDFIIKGGSPEQVGAQIMEDGAIVVRNSDGTITQLN